MRLHGGALAVLAKETRQAKDHDLDPSRLRELPTAELRQIRRHRDPDNPARIHPWLRDYQVAVDQGRGTDAVALLGEYAALKLYDTRAQAMGGMVDEWDSWRDRSDPGQSALIVHGPNSDVDLVNELAQQRRLEAGELGTQAVPAVDRNYLLRPGDVVAVRDAAYTFPPGSDGFRPKRVENGQIAVIDAVDPDKDAVRLLVREPGADPRLVEIDQARLRTEHAAGKRGAAVRLAYAMHSFPAQGATVQGTATLAGHWSQAKRETYVGDTRPSTGTRSTSRARTSGSMGPTRTASPATHSGSPRAASGSRASAPRSTRRSSSRPTSPPRCRSPASPASSRAPRSRRRGPRPTPRRDQPPELRATCVVQTGRTVRRQPSRARRTRSSSSSDRDRRSGSLASGGSARPDDSRHCRAAAHTRRPAPSSRKGLLPAAYAPVRALPAATPAGAEAWRREDRAVSHLAAFSLARLHAPRERMRATHFPFRIGDRQPDPRGGVAYAGVPLREHLEAMLRCLLRRPRQLEACTHHGGLVLEFRAAAEPGPACRRVPRSRRERGWRSGEQIADLHR